MEKRRRKTTSGRILLCGGSLPTPQSKKRITVAPSVERGGRNVHEILFALTVEPEFGYRTSRETHEWRDFLPPVHGAWQLEGRMLPIAPKRVTFSHCAVHLLRGVLI